MARSGGVLPGAACNCNWSRSAIRAFAAPANGSIRLAVTPRSCSNKAARNPIGPAPYTAAVLRVDSRSRPIRRKSFTMEEAGSMRTPTSPNDSGTRTRYSGSLLQVSAPKPSRCNIPRSLGSPEAHWSSSPAAQAVQFSAHGLRMMPTTNEPGVIPGLELSSTIPTTSCPMISSGAWLGPCRSSWSVPQRPSRTVFTVTAAGAPGGESRSPSRAEVGLPGVARRARMGSS